MGIDIDRLRLTFDRGAFADVYVEHMGLTRERIEQSLHSTLTIQQMNLKGLAWFPTSHLITTHPQIPLVTHYRALAAAYGFDFDGIERFYVRMIDSGLLPPWVLNQTRLYRIPPGPSLIGELMCRLGLISEHSLQRCLGIQRLMESMGLKPALATIISAVDAVSVPDIYQALGIQCGMPFETLDESAPEIFEATMKRRASQRKAASSVL